MWRSARRPNAGQLFNIKKHTRNKYHCAVRRAKRECETQRAIQLKRAAFSGDRVLLEELEKTLSKPKGAQKALEGEETGDGVPGRFCQLYTELYNSADTDEEVGRVRLQLGEDIGQDENQVLNKVTGAAVKNACCRMKSGENDVTESHTSDAFITPQTSCLKTLLKFSSLSLYMVL